MNNLVSNATDAMRPQGGSLYVRSREGRDWCTGRKGVVLTMADTGAGMSLEMRRKVFEAFYTTKGAAGTGLGLWISQSIVGRHGGTLRFRTSQEVAHSGTVFTLFLPHEAVSRPL